VKLIVGLGNPGIEYQSTPHNLGFEVVDCLANECGVEVRNRQGKALTARAQIGSEQVLLAKPETFMNLSGLSVTELMAKHEVKPETDLIVIYDELDLPLGTLRIANVVVRRDTMDEVDYSVSGDAGIFAGPYGDLAREEDFEAVSQGAA